MSCTVCEHAKKQAIEAALSKGRRMGVVAAQYRVEKGVLIKHLEHAKIEAGTSQESAPSAIHGTLADAESLNAAPQQAMFGTRVLHGWRDRSGESMIWSSEANGSPQMVTENPLSQFKRAIADAKQAYELAQDDEAMRYRMASILQEAFASWDDMGLP